MKSLILLSLASAIFAACPNYPNYFQGTGNSCYMVSQWEAAWRDAEKECLVYGGNITSIHDAFTDRKIYQWVKYNSTDHPAEFWIGGNKDRNSIPAAWVWADGTAWNYHNWAVGQPDTDPAHPYNYVYMDSIDGKWYTDEDFAMKFYVCEVPHV